MYCCACGEQTAAAPCGSCGAEPLLDGRYELVEALARGPRSTTWRARTRDGQAILVKESPLHHDNSPKTQQLVEREAQILRQLAHPQIPRFIESLVAGRGKTRSLYLVQELVSGCDLQKYLPDHRYSEDEVLDVLSQLCRILSYLHELSPPVVHRDIKPANILRKEDGTLVLVDFGAVREALRDAQLGGSTVAGTFGYMAPEQFAGDASPRSDLYALGALAVALLTRKDPAVLAGHDRKLRFQKHTVVSAPTAALLESLLALDPKARPASAREVAARIERIRQGSERALPSPPRASPGLALFGAMALTVLPLTAFGLLSLGAVAAVLVRVDTSPLPMIEPQPLRWALNLPAALPAATVELLFQRGLEKMRDRDYKGALLDFYRVLSADPDYPHVDKFAFAAGEILVVEVIEEELRRKAEERTLRERERDLLLLDAREGSRVVQLRAQSKLKRSYPEDPVVLELFAFPPPPSAQARHNLQQEAASHLASGRYDVASKAYEDVLRGAKTPGQRAEALAGLHEAQKLLAQSSQGLWTEAVTASVQESSDARSLLEKLLQEHPAHPSARLYLERMP
jgi:tetratricopeptide (TPR) repeat protein